MNQQNKSEKSKYLPYLWLLIGAVLSVFTHGNNIFALAVIFSPIFMIRFFRSQKAVKGSLLILLALIITQTIANWKIFPIPGIYGIISIIFGVTSGILILLPFLADRLINERFDGILSTLIFPVSAVCIFFLHSIVMSIGSSFLASFSLHGILPIQQILSIFGIGGLIFLISWFASMINWCWEHGFRLDEIKKPAGICIGVIVLILIYGSIRILTGYPDQNTVKTACVTIPKDKIVKFENYMNIMSNRVCPPIENNIQMLNKYGNEAADAGAKIVIWQEASFYFSKDDEWLFKKECSKLARDKKIYLVVAYIMFEQIGPGENKAIFINPSGDLETEYLKRYPSQSEMAFVKKGEGSLPVMKTSYGNVAITLSTDISYPDYVREAGTNGVDILFNMAAAWKEITPSFTHGSLISAVENGFSYVMCTGSGLSIATDFFGRTLASMNYFKSDEQIMYAEVPVKGVGTIYSYVGFLFAWLCVLAFVGCIVLAVVKPGNK